jgi:hypothetical protein
MLHFQCVQRVCFGRNPLSRILPKLEHGEADRERYFKSKRSPIAVLAWQGFYTARTDGLRHGARHFLMLLR